MNQFNVRYAVDPMSENWYDMYSIVEYNSAEEKSRNCNATNCPEIEGGKFYKCAFLLQACKLGAIPLDERNYIEIENITKQNLKEYRNSFTPGCGWCKGRNSEQWKNERVVAATQLKEPREYKKYNK